MNSSCNRCQDTGLLPSKKKGMTTRKLCPDCKEAKQKRYEEVTRLAIQDQKDMMERAKGKAEEKPRCKYEQRCNDVDGLCARCDQEKAKDNNENLEREVIKELLKPAIKPVCDKSYVKGGIVYDCICGECF